ncbi:putative receptor-like protein kinase [Hibiscus syriacus]|uniref:non-specific serine/threonine protein kinase n=1 Tax=Hibiscus syriacus TaxID=106335 RepID=A0A6A2WHR6_HIBSY|nr:putative receptor-like protein kinase [Hibiscus syriacus]
MSNNQVLEKRFNMSWRFEVDPGFDYLIRLHFCELVFDKPNLRIFIIYINNRTAANNYDLSVKAGGMSKAYHQDYFDAVSSQINTLWIQIGPDTADGASGTDALLNGLEIFNLSRNGNLAHVQRYYSTGSSNHPSKLSVLWVGIAAGVAILAVAVIRIIRFFKKQGKESGDTKNNVPGWRPLFLHGSILNSSANAKRSSRLLNPNRSMAFTGVGKQFTLAEIRAATNSFDESLVIGVGGFGKVLKGEVEDGTLAATKRANPQSDQGLAEFHTEIEMLSKIRHRHLVSMIGFCDEQNEMILVYEYMANGTLRSHLSSG